MWIGGGVVGMCVENFHVASCWYESDYIQWAKVCALACVTHNSARFKWISSLLFHFLSFVECWLVLWLNSFFFLLFKYSITHRFNDPTLEVSVSTRNDRTKFKFNWLEKLFSGIKLNPQNHTQKILIWHSFGFHYFPLKMTSEKREKIKAKEWEKAIIWTTSVYLYEYFFLWFACSYKRFALVYFERETTNFFMFFLL